MADLPNYVKITSSKIEIDDGTGFTIDLFELIKRVQQLEEQMAEMYLLGKLGENKDG